MKTLNIYLSFIAFVVASFASFANQDDVRVQLRPPLILFKYSEADRIKFFSEAASRGNFGYFVHSDEFHAWQFGVGLDFVVVSLSDIALLRLGSNFDGIADTSNDIYFRMGQTHYEVFTALEYRVLDSVLYAGYRHRCRHGADGTLARILRRTGPEIGFNGILSLGPVDVQLATSVNAYLFAFNRPFEPRLSTSSTMQAEISLWNNFALFVGAGLATTWFKEEDATVRLSPGASVGLATRTGACDLRTFVAYNRNLDTGFPNAEQQTHLVSANLEFWL